MTPPGPLEGVRVLETTQILAGPFCTMLLGDMGADVVKVEKPNVGDDTRRMGPPFIGGDAAAFLMINRNKRGIVLDLKKRAGVEVFRSLAERCDVVVENLRPGAMARLGLGFDDLKETNPGLIYCSISGFGATGPYKDRAGFDLVAQGMSGMMSITGFPDSPPVKVGVPIADLNAGMYAAYGILSAYVNRLKTGQGQLVDVSLLESAIGYTFWESATLFATGKVPGPVGSAHRLIAPYQAFQTSDGHINIGAANQSTWERLCRAIGLEELVEEPRFATGADRVVRLGELASILQETLSQKTSKHWLEVLEEAGVPAGPINNMAEVYADPHVQARRMLVELEHAEHGKVKNIGIPVKLSETPASARTASPTLGQHTEEVLLEHGYSPEEVARLREAEAIG
jgi:formyl-CoA transferase